MATTAVREKSLSVDQGTYTARTVTSYVEGVEGIEDAEQPAFNEDGILVGDWGTGFFSCFDDLVPNCLMVTFCPWISLAQITSRLGLLSFACALLFYFVVALLAFVFQAIAFAEIPSSDNTMLGAGNDTRASLSSSDTYSAHATWSYISTAFALLYWVAIWQLRTNIRRRFRIPGTKTEDCLLPCCCSWCTLAQMATHIQSYTAGSCDFGPVDALPAYQYY